MWSLWARKSPFSDDEHKDLAMFTLLDHVVKGSRPKIPSDCPPLLSFLVQDCWQMAPEKRPTMEHLLEKLRSYGGRGADAPGANRSVASLLALHGETSASADTSAWRDRELYADWSVDPLRVAVRSRPFADDGRPFSSTSTHFCCGGTPERASASGESARK